MQNRSSIPGDRTPQPVPDPEDGAPQAASPDEDNPFEKGAKEPSNDSSKNPAAVALGRLGGLKGGRARALKLSAEERSQVARRAAQARWAAKGKGK